MMRLMIMDHGLLLLLQSIVIPTCNSCNNNIWWWSWRFSGNDLGRSGDQKAQTNLVMLDDATHKQIISQWKIIRCDPKKPLKMSNVPPPTNLGVKESESDGFEKLWRKRKWLQRWLWKVAVVALGFLCPNSLNVTSWKITSSKYDDMMI